jgi:galactitol-specific phosphotransferase system IIB component
VPWLQNIKCDFVSVSGVGISTSVKFKIEFKEALERAGIKYNSDNIKFVKSEHLKQYKFPVTVKFKLISEFTEPIQMAKVINIVNSQPVNLEKNETM